MVRRSGCDRSWEARCCGGLSEEPKCNQNYLRKYNEGSLCGLWVNLASFDDYDEFINFCLAIHADESDPELMAQDYEMFPPDWSKLLRGLVYWSMPYSPFLDNFVI